MKNKETNFGILLVGYALVYTPTLLIFFLVSNTLNEIFSINGINLISLVSMIELFLIELIISAGGIGIGLILFLILMKLYREEIKEKKK